MLINDLRALFLGELRPVVRDAQRRRRGWRDRADGAEDGELLVRRRDDDFADDGAAGAAEFDLECLAGQGLYFGHGMVGAAGAAALEGDGDLAAKDDAA